MKKLRKKVKPERPEQEKSFPRHRDRFEVVVSAATLLYSAFFAFSDWWRNVRHHLNQIIIKIQTSYQMRFSLIDQITELKQGESIAAVKNLTLAEEYLQDHFPGFPVMPGVLLVEALVQTSAWLMRATEDFKYSTVLLDEAKAVKFNSFVKPGDQLVIHSQLNKRSDENKWSFKATGNVGETNVISAKLTLIQFNLKDEQPAIASGDEVQIDAMRKLFEVLHQSN